MKCCEVQTASMESKISCRRVANWREKSSIGTGCCVRVGHICHGISHRYNCDNDCFLSFLVAMRLRKYCFRR